MTDRQTDGQTDRQTDRQTDIPPLAIPAVCIACYANALVKMVKRVRTCDDVRVC